MPRNSMGAHLWAQDDQSVSRASAGHLSWSRNGTNHVLYSYAMPIASIVDGAAGRVCLVTTDGYSSTTARHKGQALDAARHRRPFQVPVILPQGKADHTRNLDAMLARSAGRWAGAQRSRKYGATLTADAVRELDDAERYALAFGVRFTRPADPAGAAEVIAKRAKTEARAKAKQQREQRKADAVKFAAWQDGTGLGCPSSYMQDPDGSVYLRRLTSGRSDDVQTSRGAYVPWTSALDLFALAKRARAKGKGIDFASRSVRVGAYILDSIDAEGNATVGCHLISYVRMAELAAREGV